MRENLIIYEFQLREFGKSFSKVVAGTMES